MLRAGAGRPWRISPRPATRSSRPSISASTFDNVALPARGTSAEASSYLREAETLAEALEDQRRLGRISASGPLLLAGVRA